MPEQNTFSATVDSSKLRTLPPWATFCIASVFLWFLPGNFSAALHMSTQRLGKLLEFFVVRFLQVAGFGWDPASERKGYLLQRIEAHPGFKPLRLGYSDAGRVTYGIVTMDEGETI